MTSIIVNTRYGTAAITVLIDFIVPSHFMLISY